MSCWMLSLTLLPWAVVRPAAWSGVSTRQIRWMAVLFLKLISAAVYGSAPCCSLSGWRGRSYGNLQIWRLFCLVLSGVEREWAGLLIFPLWLGGMSSLFQKPSLSLTCCGLLCSAPWQRQHPVGVSSGGNCANQRSGLDSNSWKAGVHRRGGCWKKWTLDEADHFQKGSSRSGCCLVRRTGEENACMWPSIPAGSAAASFSCSALGGGWEQLCCWRLRGSTAGRPGRCQAAQVSWPLSRTLVDIVLCEF